MCGYTLMRSSESQTMTRYLAKQWVNIIIFRSATSMVQKSCIWLANHILIIFHLYIVPRLHIDLHNCSPLDSPVIATVKWSCGKC